MNILIKTFRDILKNRIKDPRTADKAKMMLKDLDKMQGQSFNDDDLVILKGTIFSLVKKEIISDLMSKMRDEITKRQKQTEKKISLKNIIGKNTTEKIKNLIVGWLVDSEVKNIMKQFTAPDEDSSQKDKDEYTFENFAKLTRNKNNWKREYRQKEKDRIKRLFDCIPFDSQLRLYVITDLKDENVIRYEFMGE